PPAPSQHYPLSLHDALPIYLAEYLLPLAIGEPDRIIPIRQLSRARHIRPGMVAVRRAMQPIAIGAVELAEMDAELHTINPASERDRKSTRLNSSHSQISYAV